MSQQMWFHKWRYPNSWMVCKGKSHQNGLGVPLLQESSIWSPNLRPIRFWLFLYNVFLFLLLSDLDKIHVFWTSPWNGLLEMLMPWFGDVWMGHTTTPVEPPPENQGICETSSQANLTCPGMHSWSMGFKCHTSLNCCSMVMPWTGLGWRVLETQPRCPHPLLT